MLVNFFLYCAIKSALGVRVIFGTESYHTQFYINDKTGVVSPIESTKIKPIAVLCAKICSDIKKSRNDFENN